MKVPLSYTDEKLHSKAITIAEKWGIQLIQPEQIDNSSFVLMLDENNLSLHSLGDNKFSPIQINFNQGKNYYRQHYAGGKNQLIAKAIGISQGLYPKVLDATAGYGSDAYVLASFGCTVTMVENHPVMAALLAQALEMSNDNPVISRLHLQYMDSINFLEKIDAKEYDVIYLDPMFPEKTGAAKVKKNMQILHQLVGKPKNEEHLLRNAISKAHYRVVVKRPNSAPFLANLSPQHQLSSKKQRFDIYINASLQKLKF